jgi:hypothetical protein
MLSPVNPPRINSEKDIYVIWTIWLGCREKEKVQIWKRSFAKAQDDGGPQHSKL